MAAILFAIFAIGSFFSEHYVWALIFTLLAIVAGD